MTAVNNHQQPAGRAHGSGEVVKHTPPRGGGVNCKGFWIVSVNDPSAGSPTETLLRLLLPLNDKV